jgi:hypothetical protein
MTSEITVGIMGGMDAITGFPERKRVYVQLDGKVRAFHPAEARKFAARFRSSGVRDLVELADDIDALALEIETEAGSA